LDYGDATIGVAVSCPRGKVATGVETLRRSDPAAMKPAMHRLRALITEYGITHAVLGYPKHMDGTLSPRCEKTEDFARRLRRNFKRLTVEFWDERLSTRAVARVIGTPRHIDEMAAVYILQGYLDRKNNVRALEATMDDQIIMMSEDGTEQPFNILATKEKNETIYLLAAEAVNDTAEVAEILHFKCIATEGDDMIFELVEQDHGDFPLVMELFKADYEALEIEIEE